MNLAIVAPSPTPFVFGGAENLVWGLQRHVNEETAHRCELIKLPVDERGFAGLMRGYAAFAALDLRHFDLVISTKYPSWMAAAVRHVCYMVHPLRGLYDTYPEGWATDPEADPAREAVAEWRRARPATAPGAPQDEAAAACAAMAAVGDAVGLPGPLARDVVRRLDAWALDPGRTRGHAAISITVARRAGYVPPGVGVRVLPPPSGLRGLRTDGAARHLLVVGRLDAPKRIGLAIEAMREARAAMPLLIAGTGPMEAELRARAAGDPRVRLLGFVDDPNLAALYADAAAVIFTPRDEDYGLVALEAMSCGKPVITCRDSGGPTEFVRDGVEGLVVAPEAGALARAIDAVAEDPERARAMGAAAGRTAERITWGAVTQGLIAASSPRAAAAVARRRPIVVASTYALHPARGGGQVRAARLYAALARRREVRVVALVGRDEAPGAREIAPGLIEMRAPRSAEHRRVEMERAERLGVSAEDFTLLDRHALTPAYAAALRMHAADAEAVILSHPFAIEALRAAGVATPIWLEAQDVEADLKGAALAGRPEGDALLAGIVAAEGDAWRTSELAFACTREDLRRLEALYGPHPGVVAVAENGADVAAMRYVPPSARARAGGPPSALFVGSWHPPNVAALERVAALAEALPEAAFLAIGSACLAFEGRTLPANLRLLGETDEATWRAALAAVDVALNPMTDGSGSNLKMFDYFAAGAPTLSTPFGARGIAAEPGLHYVAAEVDGFAPALRRLFAAPPATRDRMAAAARRLAERRYDWTAIADRLEDAMAVALRDRDARRRRVPPPEPIRA